MVVKVPHKITDQTRADQQHEVNAHNHVNGHANVVQLLAFNPNAAQIVLEKMENGSSKSVLLGEHKKFAHRKDIQMILKVFIIIVD